MNVKFAQTVLGECIRPTRDIIIGLLTRLGPGGPRTLWRLSMGKVLSLFLSIQPHIQRILGIRRPRRKADLLPPCRAEVMNEWSCTFTLTYVFMAFPSYLMFLTLCMLSGRNLRMWRWYRPFTPIAHMINTKTSHFRCSSIALLSFMAGAYNGTGIVALISTHINSCNYTSSIVMLFMVFVLYLGYWMTLRTGEDILIWRRRLCIALYGGIVLEEALDLSSDRILNEWIILRMPETFTRPFELRLMTSFYVIRLGCFIYISRTN